ncbi:hypothetical protein [Streptomyces sp. KL116D]|uniref:hypothetical protein n=1 Tax=Streptomyces sp. KL116D TaxID=3045152 RepID=UPI003557A550
MESALLMAMTAWQCAPVRTPCSPRTPRAELASMRLDRTDLVRRTTAVTTSGLLARREPSA